VHYTDVFIVLYYWYCIELYCIVVGWSISHSVWLGGFVVVGTFGNSQCRPRFLYAERHYTATRH